MAIEVLSFNHYDAIRDAFQTSEHEIRVISPFVKPNAAKLLVDTAQKNPQLKCTLITRFDREDFITAASSLNALADLVEAGVGIIAVRRLHTKLYLFDGRAAIVGSANFTHGGLIGNLELSLMLTEEPETTEQLSAYFEHLLEMAMECDENVVDADRIAYEQEMVRKSAIGRDKTSKRNETQYGAELPDIDTDEVPFDPVEQVLSELQSDAKAVLKFEGQAQSRYDPKQVYHPNYYAPGQFYFTSAPFFPQSLTADKQLFMAALSWDKAGRATPMIVGRASTTGANRANKADAQMMSVLPWTEKFPWYVIMDDIEVLNQPIEQCISLLDLITEIGKDLYPGTAAVSHVPVDSLRTWHYRKSYIHITPAAAGRINQMLDDRFSKTPPLRF